MRRSGAAPLDRRPRLRATVGSAASGPDVAVSGALLTRRSGANCPAVLAAASACWPWATGGSWPARRPDRRPRAVPVAHPTVPTTVPRESCLVGERRRVAGAPTPVMDETAGDTAGDTAGGAVGGAGRRDGARRGGSGDRGGGAATEAVVAAAAPLRALPIGAAAREVAAPCGWPVTAATVRRTAARNRDTAGVGRPGTDVPAAAPPDRPGAGTGPVNVASVRRAGARRARRRRGGRRGGCRVPGNGRRSRARPGAVPGRVPRRRAGGRGTRRVQSRPVVVHQHRPGRGGRIRAADVDHLGVQARDDPARVCRSARSARGAPLSADPAPAGRRSPARAGSPPARRSPRSPARVPSTIAAVRRSPRGTSAPGRPRGRRANGARRSGARSPRRNARNSTRRSRSGRVAGGREAVRARATGPRCRDRTG